MDNTTNDINDIGTVVDASACGTACIADSVCEAWFFYTDSYPIPSFHSKCILKHNLASAIYAPIPAIIWAFKGCV